MPSWFIKAAIQGGISLLPNPQRFNRLFQQYVTKSLTLRDDYVLEKWHKVETHLELYKKYGKESRPSSCLEIGTGWFPIVPIGFALCGVQSVISIDTQPLTNVQGALEVARAYVRLVDSGRIVLPQTPLSATRLELLRTLGATSTLDDVFTPIGVSTLVADARRIPMPNGCIALITSNNTFEHIPGEILRGILTDFRRVLEDDGVMSHQVDMSDHFANFDSKIDVYNFLQFSESVWKYFNTSLQYQNRLRVSDFRNLFRETGWDIVHERNHSKDATRLPKLAPEFSRYEEDDLLVHNTWHVVRKAQS
jgi:hypothetical protein